MTAETMLAPPTLDNWTRAAALELLKERLEEACCEARSILQGTGPILESARPWLARLDQALGTEPTTTIDDTIEHLRHCPTLR